MNDEILIVGGGFAGLTAARELSDAGLPVRILEARDRLGGRTWSTTMPGTDIVIEMGGTWFSPEGHPHVAAEAARYGVATEPGLPIERFIRCTSAGRVVEDGDVLAASRRFYQPVDAAIADACRRIREQWEATGTLPEELDVPAEGWIDGLDVPADVREMLHTWLAGMGGADPADQSILVMLSDLAFDERGVGDAIGNLGHIFTDGTGALVEALRDDINGSIEHGAIVEAVRQDADGVSVTLAGGRVFRGTQAIIARPLNCWRDITFDPPLSDTKQEAAAEGQPGRSTKVLLLAAGTPAAVLAEGYRTPVQALLGMRDTPSGVLMAAFDGIGLLADPTDPSELQAALRLFEPDLRVQHLETHDWNADPFARGAWATCRPGRAPWMVGALSLPEGLLHFAGGDIAREGSGYIEGAITSGIDAAAAVVAGGTEPAHVG